MSKRDRPLGWAIYHQQGGELGHPPPGDPVYAGYVANTWQRRATQRFARFWRWFTAPTLSPGRVVIILVLLGAVNALHVEAGWPWWAADVAVLAAFTILAFAGELMHVARRSRRRR